MSVEQIVGVGLMALFLADIFLTVFHARAGKDGRNRLPPDHSMKQRLFVSLPVPSIKRRA